MSTTLVPDLVAAAKSARSLSVAKARTCATMLFLNPGLLDPFLIELAAESYAAARESDTLWGEWYATIREGGPA